ncbi:MAG: NfeD family protein [Clostridia bacterium]|nr:NfeD family protein [Clostridia bacterium]
MNDMFWFWLTVAVIMAVIEGITPALVTIWFMFGALAAMVLSIFEQSFAVQFAVFAGISAVLLIFTRPLVKKLFRKTKTVYTNADRIIGQEGVVTEEINNLENKGQITVLGQVWSAKSQDGSIIPSDKTVTVCSIHGVKAIVKIKE